MTPNLTHAEAGALLVAVGNHMIEHDVCADAVLEPDLVQGNEYYRRRLADEVQNASGDDMPIERALEIVGGVTLLEAIEFVSLP